MVSPSTLFDSLELIPIANDERNQNVSESVSICQKRLKLLSLESSTNQRPFNLNKAFCLIARLKTDHLGEFSPPPQSNLPMSTSRWFVFSFFSDAPMTT